MGSLIEKAMSELRLVDLSKRNFKQTLDSLQENAHSLILLSIQWKEIESLCDSSKALLEERAKELEAMDASLKVRALELEAKASDLEKKEEALGLEEVEKRKEDDKVKELEEKAKELEFKVRELQQKQRGGVTTVGSEFEPLVSLLAKNIGTNVSMPTNSSTFRLSGDDLVKRNQGLARTIPCLDPAKLVLDAVEGCFKEDFGGGGGDRRGSVVDSCILLLEKLMEMKVCVTREVKQEATQLGIDWINKAIITGPKNDSLVLGCLVFLAAYGLDFVTTPEVLLHLSESFLLYEQAPRLFRRLGLEDNVSDVVETLKMKDEYVATLRFICEFRLSKLCPGWRPRTVLHEFLQSLTRVSRVTDETGNFLEVEKAKREKRKADAAMAIDCIREKKAESLFNANALKELSLLAKKDSAPRATEPVRESCGNGQNKANAVEKSNAVSVIPDEQKNETKRQRLTEPITPCQNSTVNQLKVVPPSSGEKAVELVVNHPQPDAKATNPLSTETELNILSCSTNADTLRKLLEKQPPVESDISNAIKCSPNPAKLVLETSMALCPKTPEGGYEFKLLVTSDRCLLLLDQLKKLPLQIEHPVKDEAKKLAVHWKDEISKSKTDELEAVCFLKFVGIFGIVSEFKANDLLALLDSSYWQTVSPDLCQFLGLDSAIPGFIQNLIKTGYRLKAVDYIYSLGMVHRFQPVSAIINDSMRITKESAEKSYRDANNEPAPQTVQVAAVERQIKTLRAAIKCISCHKLESEFQLGDLEAQIKSLLKRRRNLLNGPGSGSNPNSTVKQSQPNSAGVGSVTGNTPSEPAASSSVTKPGSTSNEKRGQKRSFSENKQSSGRVTSTPRNNFQGNEGQSYRVDHHLSQRFHRNF
ncbi:hypothetical protein BRARA_F02877 [Brassica rapa]|uniref:FRIGIDA-like protein n=1 Tax=Brassica campestris TaxID=3711 RepID=A0A397Z2J0_BRACM|nr:hypothetical protein BRARA_F02877 [Brassica rapa]